MRNTVIHFDDSTAMRADANGLRSRQLRRVVAWTLAAFLVVFVFSCVVSQLDPSSRHQWWSQRGPVVPHDTFPADCSLCHEGKGWSSLRADFQFDHQRETGVALEGAHVAAQCLRCHNDRGPVAMFAARGCAGCHEDPHRGQMGAECSTCHGQDSWRLSEVLAMHTRTRFPLIGAHVVAACWRCHPGAQSGNFARADTSCEACHQSDLAAAVNPDHVAQGWISDCQRCHVPIAWSGGAFNHAAWPLTGRHSTTACVNCHAGGVFAGTPTACVDCHMSEYQTATDPNHVALNLSLDCQRCHNTNDWDEGTFNHVGIASGCVQCHLVDYQNATQPNHTQFNLSQTCEQCHGTASWNVNNFNHAGIANQCAGCHLADYASAQDPNHVAANLGQVCEQCHTSTSNWLQENWNHSWFPIKSGEHNNFRCSECHLVNTNYTNFSCTHCHDHRQSEMDDEHEGVSGYTWVSSACYQCHPDGKD